MSGPRRDMKRLGDVLPDIASRLGIDGELKRARQMAAWQRLVAELVPAASGASGVLAVQPPALVVSASSPIVAQELRLRAADLLTAFGAAPDGVRLLELRVVIRVADGRSGTPRAGPGPRVD